jgi:uncharacterized protein YneF (UPF0154 family)
MALNIILLIVIAVLATLIAGKVSEAFISRLRNKFNQRAVNS